MTATTGGEAPKRARHEFVERLCDRTDSMGAWAVGMVRDGFRAYQRRDAAAAQEVIRRDDRLNALDVAIEQEGMQDLATQQPEAGDLRIVAAALKVASYLDRVGRQGYDMARLTLESASEDAGPPAPLREEWAMLEQMSDRATIMVERAVSAFRRQDSDAARTVVEMDDAVDALNRGMLSRLTRAGSVGEAPSAGERIRHALVARSLERVADNACKIAEKTVYSATGLRRTETTYLPHRNVPSKPEGSE